jgi:hypothetical protein
MNNELGEVLTKISEEFREEISEESGIFLEVDIGKQAEKLGYSNIVEKYRGVDAVVPLKRTVDGMKVMQLESGVVIPGHVAKEAALPYKRYEAHESIVRVFG